MTEKETINNLKIKAEEAHYESIRESLDTDYYTELAQYVRERWVENRDYKSDISTIIKECDNQRSSKYDDGDVVDCETDVFLGITDLKCSACEDWLKDVLVNAADKPWTIEPTPIPDLSDVHKENIRHILKREILARGYPPDVVADKARLEELKTTVGKLELEKAKESCDEMSNLISDQLTESSWRKVFEQWQSDIVTYPAGILKGPVVKNVKTLKWNGADLITTVEPSLTVERIAPQDFYPSPEATNPQDTNNIIEVMRMTKSKLYECIGLPNFNDEAIRLVLFEFGQSFYEWTSFDRPRDEVLPNRWGEAQTIDVLDFWGRVTGRLLEEWGIEVEDRDAEYECNVWLVDKYVIRALLNPEPLGRRPYHVAHFRKEPGKFWGKGIPQILRDCQRIANASARSLVKNMSISAGPIVELDVNKLDRTEESPERIEPWRVYHVDSELNPNSVGPAIRYNLAPSVANELLGVMNRFLSMADELSGVPAYTYGQMGGMAHTLGGFSLQYSNALKGIKGVLANMDRDGIEPLITQFWTYNMLFSEDDGIKADAKVVAKGSQGILQREQAQARSIETLQVISPFLQSGLVPPQAARDLLVKWSGENGYDISKYFPDIQSENEIASVYGGVTQPTIDETQGSLNYGEPKLDNRSAPALEVLQNSQLGV